MLANIENTSLLRLLVTGLCSAILTMTPLTRVSSAATVHANTMSRPGNCLYVTQLASDPAIRAEFMDNNSKGTQETDYSELYESNIKAGSNDTGSRTNLDANSKDCLACHDGVFATGFKVRIKNDPNGRAMSLEDIVGGHPVGMQYETYAIAKSADYKSEVGFSKDMVFADGKIGCLTCHNPLNEKKGHLVMNNDRSELCFACHNK